MKRRIDPFWPRMAVLGISVGLLFWGWGRMPVLLEYALFVVIFVVAGMVVIRGWIEFLSGGKDKAKGED